MIDIEFFSVDLNNVPLSFDFDILAKSFKLLIKYNSFDKKYYCDLMTTNRETIIQNEPIIENRPLFWGYLYDMDSFVNIELCWWKSILSIKITNELLSRKPLRNSFWETFRYSLIK